MTHPLEETAEATRRYVQNYTKSELLERGLREGVTIAPVSTTEDLTRFGQLEERGFWLQAPLPDGRELPVPGLFAKLTETPMNVRRWAPNLVQHNVEILGDMLDLSDGEIAAATGSNGV